MYVITSQAPPSGLSLPGDLLYVLLWVEINMCDSVRFIMYFTVWQILNHLKCTEIHAYNDYNFRYIKTDKNQTNILCFWKNHLQKICQTSNMIISVGGGVDTGKLVFSAQNEPVKSNKNILCFFLTDKHKNS